MPVSGQQASSPGIPFTRYLASKKPIDDRALNAHVWDEFARAVASFDKPRILEPGCGIGTMLERMIERQALTSAEYLGIDLARESIEQAPQRLAKLAVVQGHDVVSAADGGSLHITGSGTSIEARFMQADVFEMAGERESQGTWHLIMAHAFLDLVDIPSALQSLLPLLRPGGLFYFTLVFDGLTVLEPELDSALDSQIMQLYHRTMDERMRGGIPSGDSRAGRHLFGHLRQAGAELLEAGGSDWVIFPRAAAYSKQEIDFLGHILQTIEAALAGHPELDPKLFTAWIAARRNQLNDRELTFVAHQLDFLGRVR